MNKEKIKKFFERFWYLLWKDNSFKGWILSLVVIFVFIKFIFFPLLSLVTGTPLPLAIVESCSMYHSGNVLSDFNAWWERHNMKYTELNVSLQDFERFSFKNGFGKGDILFITGVNPAKIKIGDIIIFRGDTPNPVIHRVIGINNVNGTYFFSTEGDNNNGQLSFEKSINQNQVIGKASFRIVPFIGWAKLIFFESSKPAEERGLCSEN
ncbi:MAG TPA: signal peptidase I [Candidatus Omnitrophota bacterium]|nr:signal peptidase I [Candidatus Omnitrophota bacterium]